MVGLLSASREIPGVYTNQGCRKLLKVGGGGGQVGAKLGLKVGSFKQN